MPLKAELVGSIAGLPAADWDALDPSGHPFLRHAFLEALESTGCVGQASGWLPYHLVVRDRLGALVAAVPQYLKAHSWGEFIFDMSWAQGYARAGLEYYPKLLSAVPFTPVTGPRLLVRPGLEADDLRESVAELLIESARASGASGAHVNFTLEGDQSSLERAGFIRRHDCRFLWRNEGYRGLRGLPRSLPLRQAQESAARAAARGRVRHRVSHAARRGDRRGSVERGLRLFRTHLPAARQRALPERRFPATGVTTPSRHHHGETRRTRRRAGGSGDLLPGRRLRCTDGTGAARGPRIRLHFEACYYQGIEYCIEQGLRGFDPGTQGEHKIARGFEPTRTCSAHWLAHPGFAEAVGRYLQRERAAVDEYIAAASAHLPFQRGKDETAVIPWLRAGRPARCVPAGRGCARGAGRPALRRRRPLPAPTARRLSARDLPVVLGRPADPVVVAGSPRRPVPSGVQDVAQPRQGRAQPGIRRHLRPGLRGRDAALRRCAAAARGHLDLAGHAARPTRACTISAMRTRWKRGSKDASWAGSTALHSAECSSANRCSAPSEMPRKWRCTGWSKCRSRATSN